MTTTTPEKEAELRRLLEGADLLPTSLETGDHTHRYVLIKSEADLTVFYKYNAGNVSDGDRDVRWATLIVAAVNALPDLLSAISTEREGRERAEAELAALKQVAVGPLSYTATRAAKDAAEAQISALQALIAEKDEALGELITEANRLGPQLPYNAPTKDISRAIERARTALNSTEAKTGEPG